MSDKVEVVQEVEPCFFCKEKAQYVIVLHRGFQAFEINNEIANEINDGVADSSLWEEHGASDLSGGGMLNTCHACLAERYDDLQQKLNLQ